MKRFILLLLFSLSIFSSYSQETIAYDEIENIITDDSYFFEDFYSVNINDYFYAGSTYMITAFDKNSDILHIFIPTYNDTLYVAYAYPLEKKNIIRDNDDIIISSKDVFYSAIQENEFIYITLELPYGFVNLK